jgi:hypothetical protein
MVKSGLEAMAEPKVGPVGEGDAVLVSPGKESAVVLELSAVSCS